MKLSLLYLHLFQFFQQGYKVAYIVFKYQRSLKKALSPGFEVNRPLYNKDDELNVGIKSEY